MEDAVLFYGYLESFLAIWYSIVIWYIFPRFVRFGIIFGHLVFYGYLVYFHPVLVNCVKKNLATLLVGAVKMHTG
jgi:hypothetical protein